MTISDLSRFEKFLAVPVEDVQGRAKFGLTEAEVGELHALAVQGQATWPFYHQVNNARMSDFVFRQSGKDRGWTVAYIRSHRERTEYRQYSSGKEEIMEWTSGRLWPKGLHIERIRSGKDPLRVIREVELAFSPDADLEELWERHEAGLELEGIELLQQFPDDEFVQGMCFLPEDPNLVVRLVISAGERRKELTFPLALRYKPLLKWVEKKSALDVTKTAPDRAFPLQRASTEEMQEALSALWDVPKTYDKTKGPLRAFVKKAIGWHMGEEFKRRSNEIKGTETGKTRRVLRAALDRKGGSVDDPIKRKDGTKAGTLGDTIVDPHAGPPDQKILLEQIFNALVDEIDRQIFRLYLDGYSQKEIAKKLKTTQPTIASRLKRMGKRFPR